MSDRRDRAAAALLTGPLAFLVAGLIDLTVFSLAALRAARAARRATSTGRALPWSAR